KFSRKSPSEHPISAKNDFSGNFHENRPVSTQLVRKTTFQEIFTKIAQ
ncbi:hypothetical protein T10_4109, partial [Trichinella papuae]